MIDESPDYSFSRQREDETVVVVVRKHWYILAVRIAWSTLVVILITAALVTANYWSFLNTQGVVMPLLYIVTVALWMFYMVYEYYDWWEDKLIITDQRILGVDRKGLFSRSVTELELVEIQDLNYAVQGLLGTMFRFGEISIESASDKVDIYMNHIQNPKYVQEKIAQLVKQAKTKATSTQSPTYEANI